MNCFPTTAFLSANNHRLTNLLFQKLTRSGENFFIFSKKQMYQINQL